MFFRKKTSGGRAYLQIVENRREDGAVRQQVIATLGRLEDNRAGFFQCSQLSTEGGSRSPVLRKIVHAIGRVCGGESVTRFYILERGPSFPNQYCHAPRPHRGYVEGGHCASGTYITSG